jgi:hypothetical protein
MTEPSPHSGRDAGGRGREDPSTRLVSATRRTAQQERDARRETRDARRETRDARRECEVMMLDSYVRIWREGAT